MNKHFLVLVCSILLTCGCAAKSKFVYDQPVEHAGKGTGSIVAALGQISDKRTSEKEIDKYYDGEPLKDIQSMLENELLSTNLFERVVTVTDAGAGVKADVIIDPSLTRLDWEVPDYEALKRKAFVTSLLTGGVGGAIYGSTDTDVYGDSGIQLRVTEQATGKVLLDKSYSGHHEEKMVKFKCDIPETRVAMAGKSLRKAIEAIKSDLREVLGNSVKTPVPVASNQ